jgi:UDP-4-amino-4,6-dideoxy-N-acetyl-beta-L-altrosamine transaminase
MAEGTNEVNRFLPYGRQCIEDDDVAAVTQALRADLLTTGPLVAAYEHEFARSVGARYAVVCNNGTAALHLAIIAENIAPGKAVVVPSITFLATANAVRMTGGDVVFADVDPDSGLMTEDTFEEAMRRAGRKIKLAIPVHLNGSVCDMVSLKRIADRHGVALIEDACHALGAPSVGATKQSRAACFSTHPVKAIATGEGGCVTTNDEELAGRMRLLRNHGMTRDVRMFQNLAMLPDAETSGPWYYEMRELGWNYRLPDILCALGISQLKKLEKFWKRRCELAQTYDRLLAPLAPLIRPASRNSGSHGWHLYAVLIDFPNLGIERAEFMRALYAKGIGSQVHYIPVYKQPYYRALYGAAKLLGAESYYARCLSLPMFSAMSDDDVERVVNSIDAIINNIEPRG